MRKTVNKIEKTIALFILFILCAFFSFAASSGVPKPILTHVFGISAAVAAMGIVITALKD